MLQETLNRAQAAQMLQENAHQLVLKEIAEQIKFLQECGASAMEVSIPHVINRIPLQRDKAFKAIQKTLRKIGYQVLANERQYTLYVSWKQF